MSRRRLLGLATLLGLAFAAIPVPAMALSAPRTLVATRAIGALDGLGPAIGTSFPIDFLALSWTAGDEPWVRFRRGAGWGPWSIAHEDEIPVSGGRTWSRLIPAGGAGVYQVLGRAEGMRGVALNTTDGPRSLVWATVEAHATHIAQPAVISRAEWGADESLRFEADGTEKGGRTFYPTGKLIVHHTVTANDDPDPAATVRAIYAYHVNGRGFADIAYNFLVDAQGRIYKGRYSGPKNTTDQDTPTGEDARGYGVTGAHTGGWNSGTMGIAILGDYSATPIPDPARAALVQHLAWESERHALDPLATTTFTSPATGSTKTVPNISGHREWTPTACPGETLFEVLPAIRQEVAAWTGAILAADTAPPIVRKIEARRLKRRSAVIRWRTDEPATGRVRYREKGGKRRVTKVDWDLTKLHVMRLPGLDRGTRYHYEVISRDAAGNAAKGRQKRFKTKG